MNNNIKIEFISQFTNGFVDHSKPKVQKYVTESTDDLKLPSMVFDREKDAELAVAIAKAKQSRGIDYWSSLHNDVIYTFRVLGLTDSGWV